MGGRFSQAILGHSGALPPSIMSSCISPRLKFWWLVNGEFVKLGGGQGTEDCSWTSGRVAPREVHAGCCKGRRTDKTRLFVGKGLKSERPFEVWKHLAKLDVPQTTPSKNILECLAVHVSICVGRSDKAASL